MIYQQNLHNYLNVLHLLSILVNTQIQNKHLQKVVNPLLPEKGVDDDGLKLLIQKKGYSKATAVFNNFFPNILPSTHFKIVLSHFQHMIHFGIS